MPTSTETDYITTLARDMVSQSPLGEELSDEECDTLADAITVRSIKAGDVLCAEGQTDDSIHVIVDGQLAVTRVTAGDEPITLHVLKKGEMAGELGFIDGRPHSATLTAVADCEVFSMSRANLESMLYTHPDIVYKVMRAIMRTVHRILCQMNAQFVEMSNYISKQHGRY